MSLLDWLIVAAYGIFALLVGIIFTKRASKSTEDYFVAGRSLSWFIAGTSIVATTFSSDTPLVVAGISRHSGISGHWFWLAAAIGQTATIFFFSRLWRRTEAMTDIEFISQRYGYCKSASVLRVFKVIFDGILLNCIVMASVILAMAKILKVLLNVDGLPAFDLPLIGQVQWVYVILFLLGFLAVFYSVLSGLYGVVYTDLLQFILAMVGSIALAVIVYKDAGSGGGFYMKLSSIPDFDSKFFNFFPNFDSSIWAVFTFCVYIGLTWWHRVPGNGYYVQRLLATISEKDSFLAFFWFNICQYVIRPWPWIIVGLFSLYYLPDLSDPESSFPEMINLFLPAGLKGIMVTSMLAAFMSTIDTHLNWGTSYIINDIYKPFLASNRDNKHYIRISRIMMILLMLIALTITTKLQSIFGAYKYLSVVYGSTATVMIARWYWWRVNPFSELSAIITSLVVANILAFLMKSTQALDLYPLRLLITVFVVTAVWILATFLTSSSKPSEHIIKFYIKMKIPGPGWEKIRQICNLKPVKGEFKQAFYGWIACVIMIYAVMIGIGKLLLLEYFSAFFAFVIAIISGIVLKKLILKLDIFK